NWTVDQQDGKATAHVGDYSITADGNGSVEIKNECTGKVEYKSSGDPHDQDGAGDKFDRKGAITLELGHSGIHVTIETTPAGNGTTFNTKVSITRNNQAIEMSGIAPGNGDGALRVKQSFDGRWIDGHTDHGQTFRLIDGHLYSHGQLVTHPDV